jgi:hypothetical protein
MAALLSNMLSKSWVAWHAGTSPYCFRVVLGQFLVMICIVVTLVLTTG